MSKPLGVKSATKEHRQKKNPQSAEAFAEKRHAKNGERPKQVWTWLGEERWGWVR